MSEHTQGPWFFDENPFDDETVEITAASREGYIEIAVIPYAATAARARAAVLAAVPVPVAGPAGAAADVEAITMSKRTELPEGWEFVTTFDKGWVARRISDGKSTRSFWGRAPAIAAAWRIVDAEKEAVDGR